ncbi:MAG TPA: hypothetical protein DDW79_00605 [Anaerolineae bacterium]|nr:MAG: hypothetical protein A2X26_07570 [Chloroflexi bacterium GWC2_49_37]HBG73947.1 hypothetical protein [Anaerolineae bacterium]
MGLDENDILLHVACSTNKRINARKIVGMAICADYFCSKKIAFVCFERKSEGVVREFQPLDNS